MFRGYSGPSSHIFSLKLFDVGWYLVYVTLAQYSNSNWPVCISHTVLYARAFQVLFETQHSITCCIYINSCTCATASLLCTKPEVLLVTRHISYTGQKIWVIQPMIWEKLLQEASRSTSMMKFYQLWLRCVLCSIYFLYTFLQQVNKELLHMTCFIALLQNLL